MKDFKIVATGDMFPGNMGYHSKTGIGRHFSEHGGEKWEIAIRPMLSPSDMCIVNLESPLIHRLGYINDDYFAGSIEFANFMKSLGVTHANVANNHILEQGLDGFYNTIEVLEKAGIVPIGITDNGEAKISYYESCDVTVGIAAFNSIHDIESKPYDVYARYSDEEVIKAIAKMNGVDIRIIVIHWGYEYTNIPSLWQVNSARKFIDYGADLIIGHHPHVLQPVIRYKNGIIAFSLGNFLFDMFHSSNVREGVVLEVVFERGQGISYKCHGIRNTGLNKMNQVDDLLTQKRISALNAELINWLHKPKSDYEKDYIALAKRNRTINRILMKIDLLKNICSLSYRDIEALFRSFIRR